MQTRSTMNHTALVYLKEVDGGLLRFKSFPSLMLAAASTSVKRACSPVSPHHFLLAFAGHFQRPEWMNARVSTWQRLSCCWQELEYVRISPSTNRMRGYLLWSRWKKLEDTAAAIYLPNASIFLCTWTFWRNHFKIFKHKWRNGCTSNMWKNSWSWHLVQEPSDLPELRTVNTVCTNESDGVSQKTRNTLVDTEHATMTIVWCQRMDPSLQRLQSVKALWLQWLQLPPGLLCT